MESTVDYVDDMTFIVAVLEKCGGGFKSDELVHSREGEGFISWAGQVSFHGREGFISIHGCGWSRVGKRCRGCGFWGCKTVCIHASHRHVYVWLSAFEVRRWVR